MGKKSKNSRKQRNMTKVPTEQDQICAGVDRFFEQNIPRKAPRTLCRHVEIENVAVVEMLQKEIKVAIVQKFLGGAESLEAMASMVYWCAHEKYDKMPKVLLATAADHLVEFGYDDSEVAQKLLQLYICIYNGLQAVYNSGIIKNAISTDHYVAEAGDLINQGCE